MLYAIAVAFYSTFDVFMCSYVFAFEWDKMAMYIAFYNI